jgi:hypothetical protein
MEKMSQESLAPASNECIFAAISHFFGWLDAVIVWDTYKDRSPLMRFQSIQALALDQIVSAILFHKEFHHPWFERYIESFGSA